MEYKAVRIAAGKGGHGGPMTIKPTPERKYIASVTGGGIHPLAQKIAELTGAEAVDGFRKGTRPAEMACVIIDCGGSGRCGVYPSKKVPTINLIPLGPTGFLSRFMTPELYVSGVGEEDVQLLEE